MEKHNKDLRKIKVERDYLQATLMQTNANYSKLKIENNSLNVEHNKLQKVYKNMEQILLNQQMELKELIKDIGDVYQSKNEIQRQFDHK